MNPTDTPEALPLGELARKRLRGRGCCQTALTLRSYRSDKEPAYRCAAALSCRACPLRHCFAMPPLPKGEALAGRATSYWTPEARYGAKARALLQRAGPSSYNLSVSLRSTAPLVGEPLAKRRSFPLCQSLPYKGRWHGVSRDGEVVRRERLWQAGRRKEPPFGDCCSERGGIFCEVPLF